MQYGNKTLKPPEGFIYLGQCTGGNLLKLSKIRCTRDVSRFFIK